MRGLPSILFPYHNKFNKFNKTRARMLDNLSYNIKSMNVRFSLTEIVNRGSYMSAHVLLNLLNKLGKI